MKNLCHRKYTLSPTVRKSLLSDWKCPHSYMKTICMEGGLPNYMKLKLSINVFLRDDVNHMRFLTMQRY